MHDQREMKEGEWNKMRKDLDLTNPPLATVVTIEWLVCILYTIVMTTALTLHTEMELSASRDVMCNHIT